MEAGEIHFPNGNRAGWVRASPEEEAAPLLTALGLEHSRALLLLLGGADAMAPESEARLRQLFSRGLAMAAVESGALVMDGGTHTGIMALMGQGMAGRARPASLLGVVPEGRITWPGRPAGDGEQAPLDPNHSHFVLVDSDAWGGETGMLFRLAAGLAQGPPVVVVLINGGRIARDELLLAVRQHGRGAAANPARGGGRAARRPAHGHVPPVLRRGAGGGGGGPRRRGHALQVRQQVGPPACALGVHQAGALPVPLPPLPPATPLAGPGGARAAPRVEDEDPQRPAHAERGQRVLAALLPGHAAPALATLARRNAIEVDDTRFRTDIDRLLHSIQQVVPELHAVEARAPAEATFVAGSRAEPRVPPPPPPKRSHKGVVVGLVAVLLALAALVLGPRLLGFRDVAPGTTAQPQEPVAKEPTLEPETGTGGSGTAGQEERTVTQPEKKPPPTGTSDFNEELLPGGEQPASPPGQDPSFDEEILQ